MHHNPAKNVLHVSQSLAEMAVQSGVSEESLRALRDQARAKLLAARALRPTPFIDRTLYTGWNAMAVTAYLEAARVLRSGCARVCAAHARPAARRGLGRKDNAQACDCVPRRAFATPERSRHARRLRIYRERLHRCVAGERRDEVLPRGGEARRRMIEQFHDASAGGFFDISAPLNDEPAEIPLGALVARRKPLQDSPTPAGNPTAATALLRLEALSGRKEYRKIAEETLESFAGIVEHFGLYAGSYGLAAERLLLDPVQVVIVGSGPEADALEATAVARFAVKKTVMRVAPSKLVAGGIPEALEETLLQVPRPAGAKAWALVCRRRTCMPPVTDAEALVKAMTAGA